MSRKNGGGKGEPQMNVPISLSYHEQLTAIAMVDKKTRKGVVEAMIEADGRGKALVAAMKAVKAKAEEATQPAPSEPAAGEYTAGTADHA